MTNLQIEYVKTSELTPFVGNPRKHPDEAIAKLVKSIKHFGWTNPILLGANGTVLAGHARLKAAAKAGIAEVPAIRLPLSGDDAAAYVIADNKTAELTEWDWPKLGDLFGELDTGELDLEVTGFDLDEIEGLVSGLDEAKKNQSPEAEPKQVECPECGHKFEAKREVA